MGVLLCVLCVDKGGTGNKNPGLPAGVFLCESR